MKTNAKADSKSNFSIKNSISYSSFNLFTRYQSSHASFLYILIQYCPEFHHSLLVILIIKILYISFEIVTFKLLLTTFKKIYIYTCIYERENQYLVEHWIAMFHQATYNCDSFGSLYPGQLNGIYILKRCFHSGNVVLRSLFNPSRVLLFFTRQ